MKRHFSVVVGLLLLAIATIASSVPVQARVDGNPTPCYSSARQSEVDMNNPAEFDNSLDGDTNEVELTLGANGSGFVPQCSYSYTLTLDLSNSTYGGLSGSAHIRVWVCGAYQGEFTQPFVQVYHFSYTTPRGWYYGTCGKGADNWHTFMSLAANTYFTVTSGTPGYINY
jgi:hypothetical protein